MIPCCQYGLRFDFEVTLETIGSMALLSYETMLAALKECSKSRDIQTGRSIHAALSRNGYSSNLYIANSLVDMYGKCGCMAEAQTVFDCMSHRTVVSWTALMMGYLGNGQGRVALHLLSSMKHEGCVPDVLTFVAAVKACSCTAETMAVHSYCAQFLHDPRVANSLVDVYAQRGNVALARRIFETMDEPTVISWSVLMLRLVENGEMMQALELLSCMGKQGSIPNTRTFVAALKACSILAAKEAGAQVGGRLVKVRTLQKGMAVHSLAIDCSSDMYVANMLVDMYSNCNCLAKARRVFDMMTEHDMVSWNSLMFGCAENGDGCAGLAAFSRMVEEGFVPNAHSFVAALKACSLVGAVDTGRALHAQLYARGLHVDQVVANGLVDLYGKCGCMVDAERVFHWLEDKDLTAWNTLMVGYSRNGNSDRVFDLFDEIVERGQRPDGITFLCVLTCCSHAGLVHKGMEFFETMASVKHNVDREIPHLHCVVDMLGRANYLSEAFALADSPPLRLNAATWTSFLSACRKWKNVELGRLTFEKLVGLDDKDSGTYSLMESIVNEGQ